MTRAAAIRFAFVRTLPVELVKVPQEDWPPYPDGTSPPPVEVWRSRYFLVQVYDVPPGQGARLRISVQRTDLKDGITWDELQAVKAAIGFGHVPAVELFPPERDLVAVSNMRHLWTLDALPAWAWRKR